MFNSFPQGDAHDILHLEPTVREYLSARERQRLSHLQHKYGIESGRYLQEIIDLYNKHILRAILPSDPKPRGTGGKKGYKTRAA